jgi:hypothetical protein
MRTHSGTTSTKADEFRRIEGERQLTVNLSSLLDDAKCYAY